MTTPDPFRELESSPDAVALDAAMRANPADDLPRLVAGDWWEEHGDEEFAAVLRSETGRGCVKDATIKGSGIREAWRNLEDWEDDFRKHLDRLTMITERHIKRIEQIQKLLQPRKRTILDKIVDAMFLTW